jgi:hypothetical protein
MVIRACVRARAREFSSVPPFARAGEYVTGEILGFAGTGTYPILELRGVYYRGGGIRTHDLFVPNETR